MVVLSPTFLTLAVLCSSALAAPWPVTSRHSTHRIRTLPNGLTVKSYHPKSKYKTFADGIDPPASSSDSLTSSFKDSAISYLNQELGSVSYHSSFEAETAKHVYVHQSFNGIKVANAVAHTTLNTGGRIVALSSSFITPQSDTPSSTPSIPSNKASSLVKSKAGATPTDRDVGLEYFANDDGTLSLTHVVQATVDKSGHLVDVFVNAHSGEIAGLIDYTTSLTYQALPITKQSPLDGLEAIQDPENATASPNGWVSGSETAGNNAVVFRGSASNTTKETNSSGFVPKWDSSSAPTTQSNIDTARVNAFYIVNRMHDITYLYGFNEAAFNFQQDNGSKGGQGNDRVTVSVQDDSGTDNADFTTPADGQSGSMRMYLWDQTNPERDGALENDIVSHEMTHGVTNRMTGGGTGRCLTTNEAGGMGEGWSDAMAFWLEQTSGDVKDFTMGKYVMNSDTGIRSYPYSTSKKTNPYTYATVATKNEVHDIGEVWAEILINVYAGLVEASGFDANAPNNASSTAGNAIFLHLFIDSLPLQPCNPTFVTARDAWIQADKNRYNSANTCALWKAFASRGLGSNVVDESFKDNSDTPDECNGASSTTTTPSSTEASGTVAEPTSSKEVSSSTVVEPTSSVEPSSSIDESSTIADPESSSILSSDSSQVPSDTFTFSQPDTSETFSQPDASETFSLPDSSETFSSFSETDTIGFPSETWSEDSSPAETGKPHGGNDHDQPHCPWWWFWC